MDWMNPLSGVLHYTGSAASPARSNVQDDYQPASMNGRAQSKAGALSDARKLVQVAVDVATRAGIDPSYVFEPHLAEAKTQDRRRDLDLRLEKLWSYLIAKRRLRFRQDKMRARTQLSRSRMHDLIFLFDADGERFVSGHKLILARRSAQGRDLWSPPGWEGLALIETNDPFRQSRYCFSLSLISLPAIVPMRHAISRIACITDTGFSRA